MNRKLVLLISYGLLGLGVSLNVAAQENDNFRLALPSDYSVVSHQANESIDGGSVKFAPDNALGSDNKTLHLQSFLSRYMSGDLKRLAKKKPKKFAKQVLSERLKKECANFEVNVGRVRHYNNGAHINWWTECEALSSGKRYEFERGRLYLADYGAYLYSQSETEKGKDFQFSVKEVRWFDRYLNSSALCKTGKDCGLQGKLVDKIFVQK